MKRRDAMCVAIGSVPVAAMLAACNSPVANEALPPPSRPAFASASALSPAPQFEVHHLYVASGADTPSTVSRFPLNADGLPAAKPDGVLKLDFRYPGSIAIGPDGDLYVSDGGTANMCKNPLRCKVLVFAPGASGFAKPIRTLYVPDQPLWIGVDQNGTLDVSILHVGAGANFNIYAPGAHGHDAPIYSIGTHTIAEVAASNGTVYVQVLPLGVGVEAFDEATGQPIPGDYTYGDNYTSNGVTTDRKHLYANFFVPHRAKYYLGTAVYDIGTPSNPVRTIVGTGCEVSRNGGALGYGLAVYRRYLYEGCLNLVSIGGGGGGTLVYDLNKDGDQKPLLALPGGNIGVAVGP